MSSQPLITRYRPVSLDEMTGHKEAIAALRRVLVSDTCPHAFLITGPSGCGKTTTARIIADQLGADLHEFDGATNTGIDAVKDLIEMGQYKSMTNATGRKLVLIDEAHAISRSAATALLKTLEEPPNHLYFALCTTEAAKMLETIAQRCYAVVYKPLRDAEIEDLVMQICEFEQWSPADDIFHVVIKAAMGSPRKALTTLQQVHDAPTREEAERIIMLLEASEPMTGLFKALLSTKPSWTQIRPMLERIDSSEFDEAAIHAGRYFIGAFLREKDEKRAMGIWSLLDALTFPASSFDRKAVFIAAVGRMLWGANG